jgi:hypothetical protein
MDSKNIAYTPHPSFFKAFHLFSTEVSRDEKIYCVLRIAVSLCFLGHGAFGFITDNGNLGKVEWLTFYKPFGLEAELVYKFMLMPLVGTLDILVAFAVLFLPMRFIWVWATFWCLFTAFLRPLSGQGFAEFFERAGNYGPPLALALCNGLHLRSFKDWFLLMRPPKLTQKKADQLIFTLRFAIAFLLIGHGSFYIFNENNQRDYLLQHWAAVGVDLTVPIMIAMGWFELALGVIVFFKPLRNILIFIIIWKVSTEALYFISGVPNGYIWEWVERSGNYWAPVALIMLAHWKEAHLLKERIPSP